MYVYTYIFKCTSVGTVLDTQAKVWISSWKFQKSGVLKSALPDI